MWVFKMGFIIRKVKRIRKIYKIIILNKYKNIKKYKLFLESPSMP